MAGQLTSSRSGILTRRSGRISGVSVTFSPIVKIEKVENSTSGNATEFTKSKGILDKMHAVLLAQMDKSKDNLQNYATCIVMHAVEYGDVTYATKLVDDLKARKALRVDSLA